MKMYKKVYKPPTCPKCGDSRPKSFAKLQGTGLRPRRRCIKCAILKNQDTDIKLYGNGYILQGLSRLYFPPTTGGMEWTGEYRDLL